jgi:hypothetical protein
MSNIVTRWQYAKGIVNSTYVGAWLRLTQHAKARGLQGRAKSDWGRVVKIDPPVGLMIRRDGLSTPDSYFAGLWRIDVYGRRPR